MLILPRQVYDAKGALCPSEHDLLMMDVQGLLSH